MERGLEDNIPKQCIDQLYDDLEKYLFNKEEWLIEKGIFSYEGHRCNICNVEDYSGIEIVNKKNPKDKFWGWIDWVHIKPCSNENLNDQDKLVFFWASIHGSEKLVEKYKVRTFSAVNAIPRWILHKFGAIYK